MSYMVSVDGMCAPSKVHETIEDAKAEAERLAAQSKNRYAIIRLLELKASLVPTSSL